jgi:hypothetical protein
MTFTVNEKYLDSFAERLADLRSQAHRAEGYARAEVDLPDGLDGIMYAHVAGANASMVSALGGMLERLGTLCQASATELRRTAELYRTTDEARAAALDATYGAKR